MVFLCFSRVNILHTAPLTYLFNLQMVEDKGHNSENGKLG